MNLYIGWLKGENFWNLAVSHVFPFSGVVLSVELVPETSRIFFFFPFFFFFYSILLKLARIALAHAHI